MLSDALVAAARDSATSLERAAQQHERAAPQEVGHAQLVRRHAIALRKALEDLADSRRYGARPPR
jgi:hypothetical protein